jgi:hypothetical protein
VSAKKPASRTGGWLEFATQAMRGCLFKGCGFRPVVAEEIELEDRACTGVF